MMIDAMSMFSKGATITKLDFAHDETSQQRNGNRNTVLAILLLAAALLFCGPSFALAEDNRPIPSHGYAARDASGVLSPFEFERRPVGDNDILIEIKYSGICHSDIHSVKSEWAEEIYPLVAGHEIVGTVAKVGKNVTKFKVGDNAGVGVMVDSCGECAYCRIGKEQFCEKGASFTYSGGLHGGYANNIVVTERFALHIPKSIPLPQAAPMLCAGVTTYSPLKAVGIKPGDKVAVAGLGGLGHMAVQYAKSFGADVTVFEITDAKKDAALALGASEYVNTRKNPEALHSYRGKFHVVVSTIPVKFEIQPYIDALRPMGTLINLGLPPVGDNTSLVNLQTLVGGNKTLVGSLIGGIPETQEMLNYSAKHGISAKVEIIPIQQINEAIQNVLDGKVEFRYVIDASSIE